MLTRVVSIDFGSWIFHICLNYINYIFNIFSRQHGSSASLELDLEHYVVPAPATSPVYAANLTETPRSLTRKGVFSGTDGTTIPRPSSKDGHTSNDRSAMTKVLVVPFDLRSSLTVGLEILSIFMPFLSKQNKPPKCAEIQSFSNSPGYFLGISVSL